MSQRWLNGAAYFTALLAASWALRAAAPFPDIPQVRQKLEAFAAIFFLMVKVNDEALLSFGNHNAPAGAAVIYLFPPNPRSHEPMFQGTAGIPTVLSFDGPGKYPALHERENRIDCAHLNDRGAEIFARFLADRCAEGGTVP